MTKPVSPADTLFADYALKQGYLDELYFPDKTIRPQWQHLVQGLNDLGREELIQRWKHALHQISRDGVTYNPHELDAQKRPWTLDPIPLMIAEDEFNGLTEGLNQRATLLNLILHDLYGEKRLLRDKIVHPDVLFGNPAVYPPYEELYKAHDAQKDPFLTLYAADLARSTNGKWVVTGDRTRAPFGLGYVLENRIITSRMLPQLFRNNKVQRLASFFAALREALRSQAPSARENPHIVLWTKGPSSQAYFEDAYLARYLGYTLAEGEDLAVRNQQVMLKTLGALVPVEVLFRRLDDDDCDSVELSPRSDSSISGLLEILRNGKVAIANKLGSRIVESPILQSFLPEICRYLLNQELMIPTVETFWCGRPEMLSHVLSNIQTMLIRPAFRMSDEPPLHPAQMSSGALDLLVQQIKANPRKYVGQVHVPRSTTPVCTDDKTVPWHLAFRMFMVNTPDKYLALPGGLARVSPIPHVLDYTMTSGERSQDVWILTDKPIPNLSLLANPSELTPLKRSGAELPSRVGDNLFWLGRYIERAEFTTRLMRVAFQKLTSETSGGSERLPIIRTMAEHGLIEPDYAIVGIDKTLPPLEDILPETLFDLKNVQSLKSIINHISRLASLVRDRIAVDMWRAIKRIVDLTIDTENEEYLDNVEILAYLDQILSHLLTFSGLAAESMTRSLGWRFLDLGVRLERTYHGTQLLKSMLCTPTPDERQVLETVLQIMDSIMTYRSRYLATVQTHAVLDLMVVDETNPRSLAYQIARITEHVDQLPREEKQGIRSLEQKQALSIQNSVRLADVFELSQVESKSGQRDLLDRLLKRLTEQIPKLSEAVSQRFLIHAGLPRQFASQTIYQSHYETLLSQADASRQNQGEQA
jgi:uncharacterized circularly permuted ATP-grasp superfamily protein/uncharacterized alpha-E superfamily protein